MENENVEKLIKRAKLEYESKNYRVSENFANEALVINEVNCDAWLLKALISYQLSRGLEISNKFFLQAYNSDKSREKEIIETLIRICSCEIKYLSLSILEDLPNPRDIKKLIEAYNEYFKIIKTFKNLVNDKDHFDKILYDFDNRIIVSVADEAREKWGDVSRKYYQDSLKYYGSNWGERDINKGSCHHPSKYDMDDFVDSVIPISLVGRLVCTLYNEESNFAFILNFLNQCEFMLDKAKNARGYEEKYEANEYLVTETYGDGEQFQYTTSEGGDIVWRLTYIVGDDLKNEIEKNISEIHILLIKINQFKKKVDEIQAEKMKRLQLAIKKQYYLTHPEDYANLLAKRDKLTKKYNDMLILYNNKKDEFIKLANKFYLNKDESSQIDNLQAKIDQKNNELDALGFFDFKKKRALRNEIWELEVKYSDLNSIRIQNEIQFNDETITTTKRIRNELDELEIKMKNVKDELNKINSIIDSD